jgi:anti-sigma factor RsiW
MNHPSELLADLLDGTLDADARVGVEAHLATCPTCQEDLAAAAAGRDAVRALEPAPVPPGLRGRIVAAAGGGGGARRVPRWYGWAGAAAAAALIAVIALSLPEVGGGSAERPAQELSGVGSAVGAGAIAEVPLDVRDANYREADLERLASEAGATDAAALASPEGTETVAANRAARCVTDAFEGQPSGRLVHLIRARFDGRPAYVAVYLEGPGAGQGPDTAVVWVATVDDCMILSFAQARL